MVPHPALVERSQFLTGNLTMVHAFARASVASVAMLTIAPWAAADFEVALNLEFTRTRYEGWFSGVTLHPFVDVDGFTNTQHPSNLIQVTSPSGKFTFAGNWFGSTSSSYILDHLFAITTEATAGDWTLSIKDGVTSQTSMFAFRVNIDGLFTSSYLREIVPVGLQPGDEISLNPTFEWAIEPAFDASADFDSGYATVQGPILEFSPNIPEATTWSPTQTPLPLSSGYLFAVRMNNRGNAPASLVDVTTPVPVGQGTPISDFSSRFEIGSSLVVADLTAVPAPGTVAALGAGAMVLPRRRCRD